MVGDAQLVKEGWGGPLPGAESCLSCPILSCANPSCSALPGSPARVVVQPHPSCSAGLWGKGTMALGTGEVMMPFPREGARDMGNGHLALRDIPKCHLRSLSPWSQGAAGALLSLSPPRQGGGQHGGMKGPRQPGLVTYSLSQGIS